MAHLMPLSLFLWLIACLINVSKARSPSDVGSLMRSIDRNLREKGGVYSKYGCKTVSWDDAERGVVNGTLSVWGASITDTRLYSKEGQQLFTVRSDNWNEKLGHISSDDLKLIVGNQKSDGELQTVTLTEFLENAGKYGSYAGLSGDTDFSNDKLDEKVSVRFQTTFLPVEDTHDAKIEVATEAYNYNTMDDKDPKNIVVLSTSQGIAVQQDGKGAKKIFHHDVSSDGTVSRYWLEAQRTKHKVGGAQNETEAEQQKLKKAGKAVSREFGVKAMGSRFNVLMTIQIPLKQNKTDSGTPYGGGDGILYSMMVEDDVVQRRGYSGESEREDEVIGESSSARLSRGSKVDTWDGLTVKEPNRHPDQHVTVTIVFYNTVAGGVPSIADVTAAVDDMEAMYKACNWHGNLVDKEAEFMKSNLTVDTMEEIKGKVTAQPYEPDAEEIVSLME